MNPINFCIIFLQIILIFLHQNSASVSVGSYPNPQRDGYDACNLLTPGYLCDPYDILKSSERRQLGQMLDAFPDQTKNDAAESGCKKKGVTVGVALTKKPLYVTITSMGKQFNNSEMAPLQLLKNWQLDNECRKAFLLVLTSESPNEDYARYAFFFAAPIFSAELNHLFAAEQELFRQKRWFEAIRGILNGVRQIVNDRHGTLSEDPDGSDSDDENSVQAMPSIAAKTGISSTSSSFWPYFMAFVCAVLASVSLTLAILYAFHGPNFFTTLHSRFH